MFCPECGTRIEDTERFCPECGTAVENTAEEVSVSEPCNEPESSKGESRDFIISCIILTNIERLAETLDTDKESISELLDQFIEIKKGAGIRYRLADVSNYTYFKTGFLGTKKRVSLNAKSTLWEHTDILLDIHTHEKSKKKEKMSEYLFIIGGNDVIPMPCTKNYVAHNKDNKTVDSDILYSFPYGSEMHASLENLEIFKYDQLFHVGRLPFGKDSTIDDLRDYLQRDIEYTYGIPFTEAYGQCDPNWKNVSAKVAQESSLSDYMRNFDGRVAAEFYHRRMILSPMVDINNLNQIFHTEASLYYYNMHGSNALNNPYYHGQDVTDKNYWVAGLSPKYMTMAQQPNIVCTEACYGARFIGLQKSQSMMLSSIFSNTMAFLGSSRVSWGQGDNGATSPNAVHVSNADIMALVFINAVLQGYNVGTALFIARNAVYKSDQPGNPNTALTIVEFNLFGDPTLFLTAEEKSYTGKESKNIEIKEAETKPFADNDTKLGYTREDIKNESEQGDMSLLQQVRSAVNANIMHIHEIIGKHLYEAYNIEPRPAESIFKIRYANGSEEYHFNYKVSQKSDDVQQYYSVTASADGDIKRIQQSK